MGDDMEANTPEAMTVLSVRLPPHLVEWLNEEADALGFSRSLLIRQALEAYRGLPHLHVDWTDSDTRGSCGWAYRADLHFSIPGQGEMDTTASQMVGALRRELAAMGAREVWSDMCGVRPMDARAFPEPEEAELSPGLAYWTSGGNLEQPDGTYTVNEPGVPSWWRDDDDIEPIEGLLATASDDGLHQVAEEIPGTGETFWRGQRGH